MALAPPIARLTAGWCRRRRSRLWRCCGRWDFRLTTTPPTRNSTSTSMPGANTGRRARCHRRWWPRRDTSSTSTCTCTTGTRRIVGSGWRMVPRGIATRMRIGRRRLRLQMVWCGARRRFIRLGICRRAGTSCTWSRTILMRYARCSWCPIACRRTPESSNTLSGV